MNNLEVHFSSKSSEWETPQAFFDMLNAEFHFDWDVCATQANAKCLGYFSLDRIDGLKTEWWAHGKVFWMNPPYGKVIGDWVKKAYEQSKRGCTVVCLLPARTDTKWFHDYCLPHGELRFLRGRLRFGGAENSAPFPSLVVVFRPGRVKSRLSRLVSWLGKTSSNT